MSNSGVQRILASVKQLPPLSAAVAEVLASFERQDVDVNDLVSKIGLDQGIVTRVLRVANSAFYGLPNKVGTIHDAVVVQGLHNIRALVVAVGLIRQYVPRDHGRFNHSLYWQHSIGTGVCARVLAARLGLNAELAFTAGLLHDIGRLVVELVNPASFDTVMGHSIKHATSLQVAEQAVLGFDHAEIGFEITRMWNFPVTIQVAIRDHHQPEPESGSLADLVHAANALCHALDIGNAEEDQVPPLSESALQRLGLRWEVIKNGLAEIERQYAAAKMILSD